MVLIAVAKKNPVLGMFLKNRLKNTINPFQSYTLWGEVELLERTVTIRSFLGEEETRVKEWEM